MSSPQQFQARHLARNGIINLGTGLIVLSLNIVFVPLLIHAFGIDIFGIIALTWMVLANFGWLDFGFSRATALYVSRDLAKGQDEDAAHWAATALLSQIFLGLLAALILFVLTPWLVELLHVHAEQKPLVILAFRLFAFAIPFDFASRSLVGVLQAGQRFDIINGLLLLTTFFTFSVYGVGILKGADFRFVVSGLFLLRVVSLPIHYWAASQVLPHLSSIRSFHLLFRGYWSRARTMIKFGTWVSAASLLGPLLLYFDQWLIGIFLGVAILPYYLVPLNLLMKLGVFPASLTSTLFPAFNAMGARAEEKRAENYFVRSHRYLLVALGPLLLLLFVWAPEILRIWISQLFAAQATLPLRILIIGFGVGLLAPLSGSLLDSIGRPDLLVKLYLVELPLNVLLVWMLTRKFGIAGAALSFTLRAIVETSTLWILLCRLLPISHLTLFKNVGLPSLIFIAAACGSTYVLGNPRLDDPFYVGLTVLMLFAYSAGALLFILDEYDRGFLKGLLARSGA